MKRVTVSTTVVLILGAGCVLGLLWFLHSSTPGAVDLAPRGAADPVAPAAGGALGAVQPALAQHVLSSLPLRFLSTPDRPQQGIRYTVVGQGCTLYFAPQEVLFVPAGRGQGSRSVVTLRFPGANADPKVEGLSPLSGVVSVFLGSDPARWRTNVSTYASIRYRDLYPGIDLLYRGTEGHLKSEFLLSPGADPGAIRMAYDGVTAVHLRDDGALFLETGAGELVEGVPLVFQEVDGVRHPVAGGYALRDDGTVGFWVQDYDPSRALVIDPELVYVSYLGGSDSDAATSVALDSAGNVYLTGYTMSSDFYTDTSPIQGDRGGGQDVFVTQLVRSGGVYTYGYSTYLGGSANDYPYGIAVDAAGNAHIAGYTDSADWPRHNALRSSLGGSRDAFAAKIIQVGGVYTLAYSTYLGGSAADRGFDVAVDSQGNTYVTGNTTSLDFFLRDAVDPVLGLGEAFVTQIISASGAYTYGFSTYLGGTGNEEAWGIALDGQGDVYVTGLTSSPDWPTVGETQSTYGGSPWDAFVTKIVSASGVYTYGFSTYLGGDGWDHGKGIAVDDDGNVTVVGYTRSGDFPTYRPLQATHAATDTFDAFVTHILDAGGVYTYGYSTFLGGVGDDSAEGVALDRHGNAHIVGYVFQTSTDFPIWNPIQASHAGSYDAFVTKIISASSVYTYGYSTWLGAGNDDRGQGMVVGRDGVAYVAGWTYSSGFAMPGAVDPTYGGNGDAFLALISPYTEHVYLPTVRRQYP